MLCKCLILHALIYNNKAFQTNTFPLMSSDIKMLCYNNVESTPAALEGGGRTILHSSLSGLFFPLFYLLGKEIEAQRTRILINVNILALKLITSHK